jgi:hypothetical protein
MMKIAIAQPNGLRLIGPLRANQHSVYKHLGSHRQCLLSQPEVMRVTTWSWTYRSKEDICQMAAISYHFDQQARWMESHGNWIGVGPKHLNYYYQV